MLKDCPSTGTPCRVCLPASCAISLDRLRYRKMKVSDLIVDERQRQDDKWGWPNAGLAGADDHRKMSILMEEVGEVANALLEHDRTNYHAELVQVAAVCVAILESEIEKGLL